MGGVLRDDGAITIDSSRIEGCLVSGASRVGAVESSMGFLASVSRGVCAAELPTRGKKFSAGRGLQGAAIAFARRLESALWEREAKGISVCLQLIKDSFGRR